MKNIIPFIALLGILILSGASVIHAQTKISYIYDSSGNRTDRVIVLSQTKSATISQGSKLEELEDLLGDQEIRIYPNPTKGLLKIDFPSLSNETILRIYDSQGRLLISKKALEIGNDLNISAYPSGFYILVIRAGTEKQEWKIIKE